MAVISQDWAALSSADPSGTVTIGSGTNRLLLLVQTAEYSSTFNVDTMTIGGQAATGSYSVDQLIIVTYSNIKVWWWDDAALEAMSGNTISYSDDATLSKRHFNYITFKDVDQTSPVATSTNYVSSANTVNITTTSGASDHIVSVVVRQSGNRDVTNWDTLTEEWDDGGSVYRTAAADGAGGDGTTTITGDGSDADFLVVGLVIKDISGAGSGAITAPAATVSGTGTVGVNDLKPVFVTVAGVGERKIVWQGGVELTAVAGGTNISASQNPDITFDANLVPRFPRSSGSGTREITLSTSPLSIIATASGVGERTITGSGSLASAVSEIASSIDFGALWYTAKKVYF